MADQESRKLVGHVWASADSADRFDTEDVSLDRLEGWPVAYEQIGSGKEPERELFNQKMNEWTAYFSEKITLGILPWDRDINYLHNEEGSSFVIGSNGKPYVALAISGPATGNATDPVTPGQAIWRIY